jgi:hypothetical protein
MGNRQKTKRILFRTNWLVIILLSISCYSFSQNAKVPIYLQNGYYNEMPKWEEEKHAVIDDNSTFSCDSLSGALKQHYIIEAKTDTIMKKWKIYAFLSFDYEDGVYSIVKVQKNRDTLILGYITLGFFKKDNCWKSSKIIPELLNIQAAIQYLKSNAFWAFYNKLPSGYKEIDAIKSQFKDSEGILDIDKLGAYLKTKPAALAKYCDF